MMKPASTVRSTISQSPEAPASGEHRPRRTAAFFLAILMVATLPAGAAEDTPPPPTIEHISKSIADTFGKIKSLHVKCALWSELKSQVNMQVCYDLGCFRDRVDYATVIDGKKRKILMIQKWLEPTSQKDLARPTQFRQMWRAFDGEVDQSLYHTTMLNSGSGKEVDGAFKSIRDPSLQIYETGNVYMQSVGSPFYDGAAIPVYWTICYDDRQKRIPQGSFSLPGAFSRRKYVVRPKQEIVEGVRCWVAEAPGEDVLWLDEARNFAVIRRDWYWADKGPLLFRWTNRDFVEKLPGLWLPMHCVWNVKAHPSLGKNLTLFINHCDVTDIAVNQVSEALFTVTYPPGTLINDDTKAKDKSGNPVSLSYPVGVTPEATEIALNSAMRGYEEGQSSARNQQLLVALNIGVLAILGGIAVVRRRRRIATS